jgi:DNA-binding transcriptional ArsR family regulator
VEKILTDDLTAARTVKCLGLQRIQVIDELDDLVIDVVRESPDITIAECHRRVVRRSGVAVNLSTLRYRLYSLEQEGILSSQKSRNGVYFRIAEDAGLR